MSFLIIQVHLATYCSLMYSVVRYMNLIVGKLLGSPKESTAKCCSANYLHFNGTQWN